MGIVQYLTHNYLHRVILEKLIVVHLVTKFAVLYATRRFITAFRRIQSTSSHSISLRSILIRVLPSTSGSCKWFHPSSIPTKTLFAAEIMLFIIMVWMTIRFCNNPIKVGSLLPYACSMTRLSYPPWFNHPNNIWLWAQIVKIGPYA
jgi:hypothetical protein